MTVTAPGLIVLSLLLFAGCAHPVLPPCDTSPGIGPIAWVVDHGWHTEIGLPADQVRGPLAYYRSVFPGARTLMFGFGKRSFFTAKEETSGALVMGLLPGPGAIRVTGLSVLPGQAYAGRVVLLALPPGGSERLSDFLWTAIGQSEAGGPQMISEGQFPGSAFYASARDYNLTYTCNTWTAEALQRAGLPVSQDVILASGTLREVARIKGACLTAAF